jgi:homoserine acetyltransferase
LLNARHFTDKQPMTGLDAAPAPAGPDEPLAPRMTLEGPLLLQSGVSLAAVTIAYQTYGTLNAEKTNTILICHALTMDQYVAGPHPTTGRTGWWNAIVGPGNVIDTDRFFVLCANVLGGCMGSTGPKEINPETGRPYGLRFPVITIRDMVQAQARLLDQLGIEKVFCVTGGSMGAMQALEWAHLFPDRVGAAVPIAGSYANSYLYITRAMDYFDLAEENDGSLVNAFKDTPVRFCLISFTSDWLFPTAESREIVHALNANAAKVSFVEVETDKGHDAFLLDEPEFHGTLKGFLDGAARAVGINEAGGNASND